MGQNGVVIADGLEVDHWRAIWFVAASLLQCLRETGDRACESKVGLIRPIL
jgi:hypothetical protein